MEVLVEQRQIQLAQVEVGHFGPRRACPLRGDSHELLVERALAKAAGKREDSGNNDHEALRNAATHAAYACRTSTVPPLPCPRCPTHSPPSRTSWASRRSMRG